MQKSHSVPKKGGGAADDLTAEGLGWQLRAALPPMRLHSVSLCDVDGDVLWLSEGVLGPDEHGYAQEAIAALSRNASLAGTERDLEDGRAAVFLPVRAPQGAVVGIAMILIDGKSVAKGLAARLVTPQVRTVLMRIATLLKPVTPPVRNEEAVPDAVPTLAPADAQDAEITLAPEETQPLMEALRLEATQPITMPSPEPEPPKGWPRKVQPRPDSTPSLTSEQIDTILTLELTEDTPASEPIARPAARPAPAANGADRSSPALELSLLPDEAPALPGDAPSPKAAAQGKSDAQGKAAPQSKTTAAPTATPSAAATARAANSATAPAPTRARQAAPAPTPATVPPPASAAAPVILRVPTRETAPPVEKQREPSQDLVLSVQQLLKLRSGGRTRRYEVLLRSRHDADRNEMPHTLVQAAAREIGECALDEFVVTQLLGFLGANRGVWETEPASFTVNVSAGAIIDEGFTQVVEALLHRTGVAPECLGFEIPQSCCVHEPLHVERFANACDKLGCFVVLDDFTLDPRAVPLLRSRTLKLVKIDPKLTTAAMKDRVSQALVVAISQASKVLGVHSVAKRVESQQTRQWLAAIGIDFAQGFALEGPHALESLASPAPGG